MRRAQVVVEERGAVARDEFEEETEQARFLAGEAVHRAAADQVRPTRVGAASMRSVRHHRMRTSMLRGAHNTSPL